MGTRRNSIQNGQIMTGLYGDESLISLLFILLSVSRFLMNCTQWEQLPANNCRFYSNRSFVVGLPNPNGVTIWWHGDVDKLCGSTQNWTHSLFITWFDFPLLKRRKRLSTSKYHLTSITNYYNFDIYNFAFKLKVHFYPWIPIKVLKSHSVSSDAGEDYVFRMLYVVHLCPLL